MGQKIRPTAFRVGVTEDWRSRWFADKGKFGDYIVDDFRIRKLVKNRFFIAGISKTEIERAGAREVTVIIFASRPGMVIGQRGSEIDSLKDSLEGLLNTSTEKSDKVFDKLMKIKREDLDNFVKSMAKANRAKAKETEEESVSVNVQIKEIQRPELDGQLVAETSVNSWNGDRVSEDL